MFFFPSDVNLLTKRFFLVVAGSINTIFIGKGGSLTFE